MFCRDSKLYLVGLGTRTSRRSIPVNPTSSDKRVSESGRSTDMVLRRRFSLKEISKESQKQEAD